MNTSPSEAGPPSLRQGRSVWLTALLIAAVVCALLCLVLTLAGPSLGKTIYEMLQITPFAPSP